MNQFWNILHFMPKSPDYEILPFDKHLSYMCAILLECISDLKVICAWSWGSIEAFRNPIKLKIMLIRAVLLMPNDVKHPVVHLNIYSICINLYIFTWMGAIFSLVLCLSLKLHPHWGRGRAGMRWLSCCLLQRQIWYFSLIKSRPVWLHDYFYMK